MSEGVYRALQQHLDTLPVGYPPTESGVELRLLEHVFSPEEAKIAAELKFSWDDYESLESIYNRLKHMGYTLGELEAHLDSMANKGAIMALEKDGKKSYSIAIFIVGIFEFQVNKLTKEFINDMHQYFEEGFGMEMAKVSLSQLRTIPVGIDVDHEIEVSNYEDMKNLLEIAENPFVIINCVCRQARDLLDEPCENTTRREVCMGFGRAAELYIGQGWGREITRDEALEILRKNEEEGMVFRLGNSKKPEFVCSCCACCCEGLRGLKAMPNPGEITNSNYYAIIDSDLCTGCGICVDRCQMEAISLENDISIIQSKRCIGCGNCIITCPSDAIKLRKKEKETIPPDTMAELYEEMSTIRKHIKEREIKIEMRKERRKKNRE